MSLKLKCPEKLNVLKIDISPKLKTSPNPEFHLYLNKLKITELVRVMTRFFLYKTEFFNLKYRRSALIALALFSLTEGYKDMKLTPGCTIFLPNDTLY